MAGAEAMAGAVSVARWPWQEPVGVAGTAGVPESCVEVHVHVPQAPVA